jgi:hypothetical protein
VTVLTVATELDPLQNQALHGRFPTLRPALNTQLMRTELQRLLFAGSGFDVEECRSAKAEVGVSTCRLRYVLRIRSGAGVTRDELVLGTLFADRDAAAQHARSHLAPIAQRWEPRRRWLPTATGHSASLGLAVSVFPVSDWLPTLVDATDPERVADVLNTLLPASPGAVTAVDLVGLRLSRGCLLRYRFERSGSAAIYGKINHSAVGAAVPEVLSALGRDAITATGDYVVFPRWLGHARELDMSFMSELRGERPDLDVDSERERAVDAAALIAATLHRSRLMAGSAHTLQDEINRAGQAVNRLAHDAPDLAAQLTSLLAAVAAAGRRGQPHPTVLSHGSFAPSQLMLDGPRMGVLDFDRVCAAEPAFDLGRFLAALGVTLGRQGNGSADVLASRFTAAYVAAGGQPGSLGRAGLYEIAALVRTCAHSWLQLKVSRLRHASRVLEARAGSLGLAA